MDYNGAGRLALQRFRHMFMNMRDHGNHRLFDFDAQSFVFLHQLFRCVFFMHGKNWDPFGSGIPADLWMGIHKTLKHSWMANWCSANAAS